MKYLIFAFCILGSSLFLSARQYDIYFVGHPDDCPECHVLFVVVSEDDRTYIASGFVRVGIYPVQSGIYPSPTNTSVTYYSDSTQNDESFTEYLEQNPVVEQEIVQYLEDKFPELFVQKKSDLSSVKKESVIVAPNPSMGSFEIVLNGFKTEEAFRIIVRDYKGKLLHEQEMKLNQGFGISRLNLSLASGSYILELVGENTSETRTISIL